MRHEYRHLFDGKKGMFGVPKAHILPVYISPYRTKGFEGFQLICDLYGANIAGMPDFIYLSKMGKHGFRKIAMGVR